MKQSTTVSEIPLPAPAAVSSYNEWDPLEEVVVGVIEGAAVPAWDAALQATMPGEQEAFFRRFGGGAFPAERIEAARRDLEEFVHILEAEGVTVRRPERLDYARPFATPEWSSPSGLYAAMPRDLLLVVGDEIIEAPMAWRCRYFEVNAYRPLLKEYFQRGARWTAAPRPQLNDELYPPDWEDRPGEFNSVISEFEPTFDAADFMRCGRDLFVQRSHVTNAFGIEWLRRHLGDAYRIHELDIADTHPMHVDATFVPLAPGKLLINRERLRSLPAMFRSWDVMEAPEPSVPPGCTLYMSSAWLSMNILMLDEERVMVERHEDNLARQLRDRGFKPIRCPFSNFYAFGGSFHCATLDVRRRGELRSYF